MNLRHPKTIRLGGWGAAIATLLVVGAGAYLAVHLIQAGDLLDGGLIAGVTVVSGLCCGLLAKCLFVFASMQPASVQAPAAAVELAAEEPATVEEAAGDEDEAIAISVAKSPLPPPELSEDALPVFVASPPKTGDADGDDFDPNLLVVPPPIDAVDDSDSIAVERSVSAEDFDSAMDLPVTIVPELNVEEMDDVPPVVQTQTNAVVSALTQTDEIDALDELSGSVTPPPEPMLPDVSAAKPSLPDAFPDIFKSAFPKPAPTVAKAAVAPAPVPMKPAAPAPVQKSVPAALAKPPVSRPASQPVDNADDESLPVVDDLSDIAITLGPVTPTGVLPTEIPDFFLKMPTGRSGSAPAMPVMPVAPVTPRQVAPPKPVHHAQAVVRIIDSTTSVEEGDDLVTMTAIPDDWPS